MAKRYNDLHDLAKLLHQELMPHVKVTLRRTVMPINTWAACTANDKCTKFWIRIDRRVSEQYAFLLLVHEFAHAMSWDKQQKDHGIEWGKAVSRVYCVYLKWLEKAEETD